MSRRILIVGLLLFALALSAQSVYADCPACTERAAQYWPTVQATVDSTSPALADYLSRHEISHGAAPDHAYFLTPDCGMAPDQLENVLDTARRLNFKMTIFMMGSMIDKWPDASRVLLQRAVAEGHELALHSYSHPSFVGLPHERIVDEVVRDWVLIDWALGYHYPIRFIRMPFGARNNLVMQETGALGVQSVFWDIDSQGWYDWSTPSIVVNQVATKIRPGAIVILHCSAASDRAALPVYVEQLRQAGYEPRLLSAYYPPISAADLAGYPRVVPVAAAPASQAMLAPAPLVDPAMTRRNARLLELNP